MRKQTVRASKFLSLVLRHKPETIALSLDENGWIAIDELLRRAVAAGHQLDRELLDEVVATNDKQRFRISEDGLRIRANQGHSVAVDLELKACTPPDRLFHGTATKFLDSIRKSGLRRQKRQHVHLSRDQATAIKVGSRHGTPVVLVVDAAAMHAAGCKFYLSDNNVWLTDDVPAQYLYEPAGGSDGQ